MLKVYIDVFETDDRSAVSLIDDMVLRYQDKEELLDKLSRIVYEELEKVEERNKQTTTPF